MPLDTKAANCVECRAPWIWQKMRRDTTYSVCSSQAPEPASPAQSLSDRCRDLPVEQVTAVDPISIGSMSGPCHDAIRNMSRRHVSQLEMQAGVVEMRAEIAPTFVGHMRDGAQVRLHSGIDLSGGSMSSSEARHGKIRTSLVNLHVARNVVEVLSELQPLLRKGGRPLVTAVV